jgi:hypothetical protein
VLGGASAARTWPMRVRDDLPGRYIGRDGRTRRLTWQDITEHPDRVVATVRRLL